MEVAAVKATEEPNDGIASRNDKNTASHTVLIGDLKRSSTLLKNWCRPPSRLKPNIIREFEVMEKRPQCQIHTMTNVIRAIAPLLPKMSIRICTTGWPIVLFTVFGNDWIENRRERIRKNPNSDDTPIDIKTPSGALQEALRVSSDRWAEASKPVMVYWLIRTPQAATYAGEARTLHPGAGSVPVPS